jgi:tetratricopeptide (TPR) repeat protein
MIGSGILKQHDNRYELTGPLSSLDIPRTLKDSLMARLDQLSGVKKIAQVAATIGRQFSIDVLKSLKLEWVENIDADFNSLLDSQLVEKTEANNDTDYQFRHALLQETAYESLLKSTRRYYHGLIAETLVNKFPDQVKSDPGVIARHFTEAGETELAIQYWVAAGNQANKTSSHNEAISHFTKAIELLKILPRNRQVDEQEFQIQVRLIGPLIAAKSYVSPLVEKAFVRALELSKQIDSSPEIFPVLHGRYAFYQVCGLINKAESLVDEFFELAKQQKDDYSTLLMIGSRMRGSSAIMKGNAKLAEQYLKDAINIYQYDKHFSLNTLYGQDIKVISLTYLGLTYWHQGKISEIEYCANQASELAKNIPSANTIGISHIVSRVIPYVLLDEPESALKASNKAIEVAVKLETPLWKVAGIIFKGWSLVRLGSDFGKEKEGMALLEQGIAAYSSMNLGLFRPLIMNIYAQACMDMGFIVKGLETLEESLGIAAVGGELWLNAESHRIMAELLLSGPNPDHERAKEEFEKALALSRQQASITQELRVAISLYNFAKTEKEINAAITILKNAYDKFDDKKCTKDLLKAEGLLQAL